jgi:hypothetical protein
MEVLHLIQIFKMVVQLPHRNILTLRNQNKETNHKKMEILPLKNCTASLEINDQEIMIFQKIFIEVKKYLNHEPEFQTRVDIYYAEAEEIMSLMKNSYIISWNEIVFMNNIFNEACNGINIKDFENKIGIPVLEAKLYLKKINTVMNDVYNTSGLPCTVDLRLLGDTENS